MALGAWNFEETYTLKELRRYFTDVDLSNFKIEFDFKKILRYKDYNKFTLKTNFF